jgi:hypothetical protein
VSIGAEMDVTCACGHPFKAWLWQSANVTASPELRQRILAGEMNVVKCPSCGRTFHVELPFLYHDLGARQWIWVYPVEYEKESGSVHAKVGEMWEELKKKLPPAIRETFETEYVVLVVFGMDALVYYLKGKDLKQAAEQAPNN